MEADLFILQRYEAAVAAFSQALDLNPQYAEAQEQLQLVQLEQLKVRIVVLTNLDMFTLTSDLLACSLAVGVRLYI